MKTYKSSGDVWPVKRKISFKVKISNSQEIESCLQNIFTVGYPVVLSSGRVAITSALKSSFTGKTVRLFPYASQCVVTSVIKAGLIPVTPLKFSMIDISYNQWGRFNENLVLPPIIEDSVDSFYPATAKILRTGAQFEVWSLSKIFGLNYGAVLWCKNKADADKVKSLRDFKKLRFRIFRSILRIVKNFNNGLYMKWEELEHRNLELLPLEYGAILNKILHWQNLYEIRLSDYYSALSKAGLDLGDQSLEEEGVIPVVIEVPQEYTGKYNLNIRQLHRISNKESLVKVNIFPYQAKL